MENEKKKLGVWIAVDALLLLAIIVIVAVVIGQTKSNKSTGGKNTPTPANTTPTGVPSNPTDTPSPTDAPTPSPSETPTPLPTETPTPTEEAGETINANAKVDVNQLNVRTGAGTNYDQLKVDGKAIQLNKGDQVEVTGSVGAWYKIKLVVNKKVYDAYVYGPYLKTDSTVNYPITPTAAPTQPVTGKYSADDTTFQEWYEVKASNHQKQASPGNMDIKSRFEEYGAYYVDKTATDDDKVFYLTFDCGYELDYTGKTADILDVLKKHNAKACFFVTKGFIDQATESAKRMKAEGHIVGNHTNTHPNLAKVSDAQIAAELTETANHFKEKTGYDMDPYMRPPQGDFSVHSLHVTHDLGYKSIFWSLSIYDDWNFTRTESTNQYHTTAFVKSVFQNYHHSGCIALIHAVSNENVAALDDVLTFLENQGYRFGTLDELK